MPEAIESRLDTLESIAQAVVIGVKNEDGFDDIGIVVVCSKLVSTEFLQKQIVRNLGSNFTFSLKILKQLPLNSGGKIDRAKLKTYF